MSKCKLKLVLRRQDRNHPQILSRKSTQFDCYYYIVRRINGTPGLANGLKLL